MNQSGQKHDQEANQDDEDSSEKELSEVDIMNAEYKTVDIHRFHNCEHSESC